MEGLGAAEYRRERLQRCSHEIHLRLLGREGNACGLRVEAKLVGPGALRAEPLPHDPEPDPPRGAELGDLLEEVVVRVEEEAEPGCELVHREPAPQGPLDIRDPGPQRVSQLLSRGRPCLPDVIAADRDGIEARDVQRRVLDGVSHEPHGLPRWVDVLLLGHEFFEDVVLNRSRKRFPSGTLLLRDNEVHRPENRRRGRNRHGRRHISERDSVEQLLHVGKRRNGDAALSDLAFGHRVIAVVTHQCRQIEGHRKAGLPLVEEKTKPPVRLFRSPVASELPHRPQTLAVHARVDAASVRRLPRPAEFSAAPVGAAVEPFDQQVRYGAAIHGLVG